MKIDFNKVCDVYDIVRTGDPFVIKKIIEKTNPEAGDRILDLGCGTGNNAVLLSNTVDSQIYGMDQSEGMLSKAREKNDRIRFLVGDAMDMKDIENGYYDLVFMVDVIHHIPDIKVMFKNIYRILKPEGAVMIFTESHDQLKNSRLTTKYFPETLENELKRYPSEDSITTSMNDTGFCCIETEDVKYPAEKGYGEKLITLAETKSYSMFRMISQDAIDRGIARIKEDLKKKEVSADQKNLMIIGRKPVFSLDDGPERNQFMTYCSILRINRFHELFQIHL
jgi:SAM-dependent methyltransferase